MAARIVDSECIELARLRAQIAGLRRVLSIGEGPKASMRDKYRDQFTDERALTSRDYYLSHSLGVSEVPRTTMPARQTFDKNDHNALVDYKCSRSQITEYFPRYLPACFPLPTFLIRNLQCR